MINKRFYRLKRMAGGHSHKLRVAFRTLLLLVGCMASVSGWAKDAVISGVDNTLTVQSPSFSFKLLICDDDSNNAFWTTQPKLSVNGVELCTLDIPTGNDGNYEGTTKYQDKDWKTYDTTDYYVVLKDPHRDHYDSGGLTNWDYYYYYWVTVEILPKKIETGASYKATVSGKWCDNHFDLESGYDEAVSLTYTGVADAKVFNEDTEQTLSRPENLVMQYNQKLLRTYNNYYYCFEFYGDSDYSIQKQKIALSKGASSTDSNVRWTESNTTDCTYYLRQVLVNESASYGFNQTGRVEWYQDFGSLSSLGFCYPKNLTVEPGARWDKTVSLAWSINETQTSADPQGYWYVYRTEGAYENGKPADGASRVLVGEMKMVVGENEYNFKDETENVEYDTEYTYEVIFFPNSWVSKNPDACDGLNVYNKNTVSVERGGDLFKDFRVVGQETCVELNWTTESFPSTGQYQFAVLRAKTGGDNAVWEHIANISVVDRNQTEFTYKDESLDSPCDVYYYKVTIEALETLFATEVQSGRLAATNFVTDVTASYGDYADMVRLHWNVRQRSAEPTEFVLYRRLLGRNDTTWTKIYTTTGTDNAYSYEDMAVNPGEYYEYKVESFCSCEGVEMAPVAQTADGFSVAKGVVNGRVTYGTGTAVSGVKIKAIPVSGSDYASLKQQFYSLAVKNVNGGIHLNLNKDKSEVAKLHTNGDFSVQMWVNLNRGLTGTPMWLDVYQNLSLYAKPQGDNEETGRTAYQVVLRLPSNEADKGWKDYETDITLHSNTFYNTTLTYSAAQKRWTYYVVNNGVVQDTVSVVADGTISLDRITEEKKGVVFGSNISKADTCLFKGYIDEVRWWNKTLTEKDILRNHDHLLDGSENGLALYYPLDENIPNQDKAYDYSPSGLHGGILPDSKLSIITPRGKQFGLHTYTDESGNYTLRGVPFASNGTTYDIVPELGVHKFTAEKEPRYISKTSLVHNGVDFTDVSSFKVEGVVYYENTLHPVPLCEVLVDNEPMLYEGKPVMTDAEGRFAVAVPIGNHYITIKKDNHEFLNGGRYPADPDTLGLTHTFDRDISGLKFTDTTKAIVVGRVSGGAEQANMPNGMGLGKANIGQAIITLMPESDACMNVLEVVNEQSSEVTNNPDTMAYANPYDEKIKSSAYVCGGNNNDVKTIKITTDAKNGEFAALLPPVKYKVVSVEIPGYGDNDNFFKTNLPRLEADGMLLKNDIYIPNDTTATDTTATDSTDGTVQEPQTEALIDTCYYHAALVLNHRSAPQLEITDKAHTDGAFGEMTAIAQKLDGTADTLTLYTVEANTGKVDYTYHHPIVYSGNRYTYTLNAYERYVNRDAGVGSDSVDVVPLKDIEVKIFNNFSGGTVVMGAKGGESGEAGEILKTDVTEVMLNEKGEGTYTFIGGLPNIQGDHTLAMTASYEVNGVNYSWRDADNPFTAIVLGSLPKGNNFVTKGPDKVEAVLRDPPGSNSYSMWETGQVIETEERDLKKLVVYESGLDVEIMHGFGATLALGAPGAYTITDAKAVNDFHLGLLGNVEILDGDVKRTTKILTQAISTSSSPDFVGADADVYVGESTNYVFGDALNIGLYETAPGVYGVAEKDIINISEVDSLTTYFVYTQFHIKNNLIPGFRKMRNDLLRPVGTQVSQDAIKEPVYVSKVEESHPLYGTNNNDPRWEQAPYNSTEEEPSYHMYLPTGKSGSDMVFHYNEQIENWENIIARNEETKYKTINQIEFDGEDAGKDYKLHNNISFGGGVAYEDFYQYDNTDLDNSHYSTHNYDILAHFDIDFGFLINKVGITIQPRLKLGGGEDLSDIKDQQKRLTTKYVLADNDYTDAYSVDVYKSPDNDGLIFYTRGGQTQCPYEGAVMSEYYRTESGNAVELGKATMQVQVPNIYCENATQTGIPAGDKAYFELELQNNSHVDVDTWYDLSVVEESNPHGAELLVDGIGVARSYMIPAGKSVKKTLTLKQGDPSVFDYENIKIRLSSQCQNDPTAPNGEISDTVSISAYFVQTCSNIRLNIANPVMNTTTGTNLIIVVDDYNLNHDNLQGIVLEYQVQGDADWTQLKKYVTNEKYKLTDEEVLKDAKFTYNFDMAHLPDQNYVFRARTICGGDVYNETEEIVVTKDMVKPVLIGMPTPTDGIYNVGDEIAIVFAEDVRSGEIKQENITVKAVLNETPVDHQVAFKSDGKGMAATTATFDLQHRSFAAGMWVNYSQPGVIFSHGTQDNNLRVAVNEKHNLEIYVGSDMFTSTDLLRPNVWTYLHVAVHQDTVRNTLSAVAAMDDQVMQLFDKTPCSAYSGNGRVALGGTLVGAIHEVTFWNYDRSADEALSQMYTTHAPHAMGLIGYWKMDEGNGVLAKDGVRSRHMTLPSASAWYVNNENYALHLSEQYFAKVPLYSAPLRSTDDYLLEFWFKADKSVAKEHATLLSVGDSLLEVTLKADAVEMMYDKMVSRIPMVNKLDGQWHHFALNVLNGTKGATSLYIDGEAVRQFAAGEVPALATDFMYLGVKAVIEGELTTYSQVFPGVAFDEVRLWKGTYTAGFVRENMRRRVDTASEGLMVYYPFELGTLDEYNQPIVVASGMNQSKHGVSDTIIVQNISGVVRESVACANKNDAPALAAAPLMQNVPFSFSVSERKILIIPEADPRVMEGTTLTMAVKGVVDAHDNECEAVTWTAYVQQNPLVWSENDYTIHKQAGEEHKFSLDITNVGAATEYWSLSQLPEWLEVDNEVGTLQPGESATLHFTINDAIAIGRHQSTIYLSGTKNVMTPLFLQVIVKGNEPDWSVNPADYPNSMMLIARLKIMGEFSENPDNIVAAFTDNNHCVGVGRLEYVQRYDAYYVMMNVYGEGNGYNLVFKAYDADRGMVHHSLVVKKDADDEALNTTIAFKSNDVVGSFEQPLLLHATGHIEQSIELNEGWTWMSVNVMKPKGDDVTAVLKPLGDNGITVKNKETFADYTEGVGWVGELATIKPGEMYKLKTKTATTLPVVGVALAADNYPITIFPGWNWVGYTPQASTSVANALANMNPQDGDIVKSQYAFAIFDDYQWEGTLKAMHPGEGYVIYSAADNYRVFHFPTVMLQNVELPILPEGNKTQTLSVGTKYPDNMNLIAVVKDGDEVLEDAQVFVYADGEQRGCSEASLKDGKHFITIQGEGTGHALRFVVKLGEEIIPIADPLYFGSNAICGSMSDPYVLQIDATSVAADIRLSRANNVLTVTSGAGLQMLKVYDAEGRVMHTAGGGVRSEVFSVEHYAAGVYLVVAEDTTGKRRTFSIIR